MTRSSVRSHAAFFVALALAACGGKPAATPVATTTATTGGSNAPATIASFAVNAAESHKVDKIGGTDGAFHSDGQPDLVFDAQIDGPFRALFLVETDETGKSAHDFGADTLVGTEEQPAELGGMLEQGKFTSGLAVFEGGTLLNEGNGSLGERGVGPGKHALKIYINEDPRLGKAGSIQLLLLQKDGTLLKGPSAAY